MMADPRRDTLLALAAFLLILVGYAYLAFNLYQTYQAETALAEQSAKTLPLWNVIRLQPAEDVNTLNSQIAETQRKIALQQAKFPRDAEVIGALDGFISLAQTNQFFITNLDLSTTMTQTTKSGTYRVARYSVQARGSWSRLPALLRKLAEQSTFVPMSFANVTVNTDPYGDNISFDMMIYVRTS
jgi:hypothetical protein